MTCSIVTDPAMRERARQLVAQLFPGGITGVGTRDADPRESPVAMPGGFRRNGTITVTLAGDGIRSGLPKKAGTTDPQDQWFRTGLERLTTPLDDAKFDTFCAATRLSWRVFQAGGLHCGLSVLRLDNAVSTVLPPALGPLRSCAPALPTLRPAPRRRQGGDRGSRD